jgi:hypothetical protein
LNSILKGLLLLPQKKEVDKCNFSTTHQHFRRLIKTKTAVECPQEHQFREPVSIDELPVLRRSLPKKQLKMKLTYILNRDLVGLYNKKNDMLTVEEQAILESK